MKANDRSSEVDRDGLRKEEKLMPESDRCQEVEIEHIME
jgi:hypothetical protein